MTINVYQKGDAVHITGTFADSVGDPVDPTTVTFKYTNPSGTTVALVYGTDAELVKDEVGAYSVDLTPDESGQWLYRWESTGDGQAAEHGEFIVEPSAFVVEEA